MLLLEQPRRHPHAETVKRDFEWNVIEPRPEWSVTLTKEERQELEWLARPGKTESRKFIHARALLLFHF